MDVDIRSKEFTDPSLEEMFSDLQRNIYPRASRNALNRTAAQVKTRAGRITAASERIKVGAVRERIKIRKATRAAPFEATVVALTLPVAAHKVGKVRKARGVAKAGRVVFPAPAFVATMPNGLTSVFKRRGKARLPITEQGVPIEQTLRVAIERVIAHQAPAIWRTNMERQLKREVERG